MYLLCFCSVSRYSFMNRIGVQFSRGYNAYIGDFFVTRDLNKFIKFEHSKLPLKKKLCLTVIFGLYVTNNL